MVGFANTSAREIFDHLLLSYGSITDVDLEHNFENMRKAWDPSNQWRPCSSRFKIVWTMQRQDALQLALHIKSMWLIPIYLPQEVS
jgi:hypothetical protein